MAQIKTTTNLTHGNILPTLIKFTIPILLSILLQTAYGTADLFIVGQFSDVANVSGVSIGSQLSQIFINLCVGISMGATVLIGRYIGAKDDNRASKVVGSSIFGFSILAVLCTIIILTFSDTLITLMQAPSESFAHAKSYLFISGTGAVFIVFYNLLGSIFRGIGDSKTPLLTVFIACITNIILDLIFVAGFNMGAAGAATATVIAQAVSVLLSVIVIRKNGLPFKFKPKHIKFNKKYINAILKIGIPSALQMVLASFSFLALSSIMNGLGVAASAAVGIVGKITGVILVVPQAFSQSLSSFTAQNIGANRLDRANKGLIYAISISLLFGAITAYLSFFHGTLFTQMFTSDPDATAASLSYLKSYSPDCLLVAFIFTFNGYFNGCGKTTFVMLQSILGAFLIRIPFSYWFSTFDNTSLFLIGLAIPLSSLVQIFSSGIYFKRSQKELKHFHSNKTETIKV